MSHLVMEHELTEKRSTTGFAFEGLETGLIPSTIVCSSTLSPLHWLGTMVHLTGSDVWKTTKN